MANKFKFNIITGENANEKYAAIANKEPFTFYLLQTGIGYLGTIKLFDASTIKDAEGTATGKFFRSVKPHVITQEDLVNDAVVVPKGTNVGDSGIVFVSDYNDTDDGDETLFFVPLKADVDVTGKFFRKVASHVITQDDLDDDSMSKPTDTKVGDSGLIFTSDNNETDDGDEKKYFVPIKVEKPDVTESLDDTTPASKIPTAAAVINYVTQIMQDKVSFEIDGEPGIDTADGGMAFPSVYSEDEVRIGTWIDGRPLYRKVFSGETLGKDGVFAVIGSIGENNTAIMTSGFMIDKSGSLLRIPYRDTITFAVSSVGNIIVMTNTPDGNYWNRKITIIVEYIKTTDEERLSKETEEGSSKQSHIFPS